MQEIRSIKKVIPAMKVDMGGILLDQALPYRGVDQIDPFLLVHHLKLTHEGGKRQEEVGVPPHPHRGFAPVTFIFEGGVHHRDSMDISSVVYKGGTQWMHAGSGVIHSERPPKELVGKGKTWELIQFWVNVPARYKMTAPNYQPLSYEDTPSVRSEDGKVEVGVVAGTFGDQKGGVETYSPILALRLNFEKGGTIRIPVPKSFNAFVYQLDGQLTISSLWSPVIRPVPYCWRVSRLVSPWPPTDLS